MTLVSLCLRLQDLLGPVTRVNNNNKVGGWTGSSSEPSDGVRTWLKGSRDRSRQGTEMCSGSETGSYLRLIDSCITQLKAHGPSRTCNESKEEGSLLAVFPALGSLPTLEATQGQILSQSPTDATRFWWNLYGS